MQDMRHLPEHSEDPKEGLSLHHLGRRKGTVVWARMPAFKEKHPVLGLRFKQDKELLDGVQQQARKTIRA